MFNIGSLEDLHINLEAQKVTFESKQLENFCLNLEPQHFEETILGDHVGSWQSSIDYQGYGASSFQHMQPSLESNFPSSYNTLRRANSAVQIGTGPAMGRTLPMSNPYMSLSGPGLIRAQSQTEMITSEDFLQDQLSKMKKKTTGPIHNSKYKAKLCKNWVQKGMCPYFEKCQFAHGEQEIEKWTTRRKKSGKSDAQLRAELFNLLAAVQRKNGGHISQSEINQMLAMLGQSDQAGMPSQSFPGQYHNLNIDDLSLAYNEYTPSSGSTFNTFDFLDGEQKLTSRDTTFGINDVGNEFFLGEDVDLSSAFNSLNLN